MGCPYIQGVGIHGHVLPKPVGLDAPTSPCCPAGGVGLGDAVITRFCRFYLVSEDPSSASSSSSSESTSLVPAPNEHTTELQYCTINFHLKGCAMLKEIIPYMKLTIMPSLVVT
jgi:hypothetical protein